MDIAQIDIGKSLCSMHLETYPNRSPPTDFPEEPIVIGRQDVLFNNTESAFGVIGLLMLGNSSATAPVGRDGGSTGANANRIPDTATVDMRGANVRLTAQDGENNSLTELISTVKLSRGVNGLTVSLPSQGANNVVTLAVTTLNRAKGTGLTAVTGNANFEDGSQAIGTGTELEGRVTFGTINGAAPEASVVNGIIPWAINASQVTGSSWAWAYGGDFLTYGSYGLTPQTAFVTDINTIGETPELNNYKITSAQTLNADHAINSLTMGGSVELGGDKTLTVSSGALNLVHGAPNGGRLTLSPHLDFNGQEAVVFVHQGPFRLSGVLSNTGGNGLTFNALGANAHGHASLILDNNANSYTGPTTINGGLLRISSTSLPSSSPVVINEGGGIDMRLSNVELASLAGKGLVWFQNENGSGNRTLTVGSDNTSTTYAGAILDNGPRASGVIGNVVKTGLGTWTLSGINGYTGTTTVSDGGLIIDGALTASTSDVTVQTGAFLGGTGTIARNVTVSNGGLLTAGLTNNVGTLNISSNLVLATGATLDVQLGGPGSGDKIVVGGSVALNGSTLQISVLGELKEKEQYTIIDNQSASATTGAFANGNNFVVGDYRFFVEYDGGTGNDVVLTVLPKGSIIVIR